MIGTVGHFLRRLRADTAGNTLAIVGAALIPITAMIGSGLDVSRAYMAKSRMQSACDASSLAARRVMRNDTLSQDVIDTGEQFFAFNFAPGMYNTEAFEPEVTRPDVGLVRVEASTRIPTTVMKLFGFGTLPLNVSCEASLNFVNTDVVLVLDVTGSMLCLPTESSCNVSTIRTDSKMAALQDAVMALYDELEPVQTQLETQGLRLRYGIVPYSSTVNVGRLLYDADADYIRSSTPYQSRVATFDRLVHNPNTPTSSGAWEYYNGNSSTGQSTPHPTATRTSSQCQTWVGASAVNGGGPAPTATTRTTYSGNSSGGGYSSSTNRGWSGAPQTGSCRRWKTVTTTTYETVREFSTSGTRWTYRQETLDTSTFRQPGGVMTVATNATGTIPNAAGSGPFNPQQLGALVTGGATTNVTWNGCIEERATDDSIRASSGFTIPNGAYDLNINHIPDSDNTRWSPMLPEVLFTRTAGTGPTSSTSNSSSSTGWMMNYTPSQGYTACPSEARRLDEWSRDDLEDYVGSLWPVGGTYHDIGMIWGARFISTGGVFADGCEEYNEMPCNRHVIFMTDGDQTTYCNVYTAYGIEQNDMRTSPPGCSTTSQANQQLANHQQRFQMICNATKNMNVSVWVIAFGTSLNTSLVNCASNASQASTSANRDDLIARFRQIGNQIGALRLTK